MKLFGTKGQKFLPCPGTKGQRDKLKILPQDGTRRDFDRLSLPFPFNGQILSLSSCPFVPGTRKELLSLCPEKLHCPVPLETLDYVRTLYLTIGYNKDEYEPMYTKVVDPKNNEHTDSPYVLA